MNGQQIATALIVLVAAVYLGRNFVRSAQAFFSKKGGCGSGCGKCAFAQQVKAAQKQSAARRNVIPLAAVSSASSRKSR